MTVNNKRRKGRNKTRTNERQMDRINSWLLFSRFVSERSDIKFYRARYHVRTHTWDIYFDIESTASKGE